MKQYQLNIVQPDGPTLAADSLARVMREVGALVQEAKEAGVWVFNGGLSPPGSSTVVRVRAGEVLLTDGPFAEGKEFIGGLLIIRAPDLDAALEWAAKLSRATTLPTEVRPFQGHG